MAENTSNLERSMIKQLLDSQNKVFDGLEGNQSLIREWARNKKINQNDIGALSESLSKFEKTFANSLSQLEKTFINSMGKLNPLVKSSKVTEFDGNFSKSGIIPSNDTLIIEMNNSLDELGDKVYKSISKIWEYKKPQTTNLLSEQSQEERDRDLSLISEAIVDIRDLLQIAKKDMKEDDGLLSKFLGDGGGLLTNALTTIGLSKLLTTGGASGLLKKGLGEKIISKVFGGLFRIAGGTLVLAPDLFRGAVELGPEIFGKELSQMNLGEKIASVFGGLGGDLEGSFLNGMIQASKGALAGFVVAGPYGAIAGGIANGILGFIGSKDLTEFLENSIFSGLNKYFTTNADGMIKIEVGNIWDSIWNPIKNIYSKISDNFDDSNTEKLNEIESQIKLAKNMGMSQDKMNELFKKRQELLDSMSNPEIDDLLSLRSSKIIEKYSEKNPNSKNIDILKTRLDEIDNEMRYDAILPKDYNSMRSDIVNEFFSKQQNKSNLTEFKNKVAPERKINTEIKPEPKKTETTKEQSNKIPLVVRQGDNTTVNVNNGIRNDIFDRSYSGIISRGSY